MEHEMHIRHIAICGLPSSTIFFQHYLLNGTIFGGKKVIDRKICLLIFCTILSETFLILRTNGRDTAIKVHMSSR